MKGAGAKSYMTNGFLILHYDNIFAHFYTCIRKSFLIYDFAPAPFRLSLYMRKLSAFFLTVWEKDGGGDGAVLNESNDPDKTYIWSSLYNIYMLGEKREVASTKKLDSFWNIAMNTGYLLVVKKTGSRWIPSIEQCNDDVISSAMHVMYLAYLVLVLRNWRWWLSTENSITTAFV